MKFTTLKLTLICFNTMGAFSFDSLHGFWDSINFIKRQKKIAEILEKEDVDLIFLQEVHTYSFLNILRKQLTKYPYVIYKKYLYGPKGGLVMFSKHKVEKTEYIDFEIRGSLTNTSFIAHIIRNGALVCKLKNYPVYILNAHITPNLDHDYSMKNRFSKYNSAQLAQLSEIINNHSKKKRDLIAAGDFNTAKDSLIYKDFIKNAKLEDLFKRLHTPTQHQSFLPKHKKVKRIDYIFLRMNTGKIKIQNTIEIFNKKEILGNNKKRFLSDHIGLKTKISLSFNKK